MDLIFGTMHHVTGPQECARAVLIFFYGLFMLRLSGRRTFAHWSALDMIISIIVGSTMARAMTGNAPLIGSLAAVAVLVLLHLTASYAVARSEWFSRLIEGRFVTLGRDGQVDERKRVSAKISMTDLDEALREHGLDGLAEIGESAHITLEPSGQINVIKKDR